MGSIHGDPSGIVRSGAELPLPGLKPTSAHGAFQNFGATDPSITRAQNAASIPVIMPSVAAGKAELNQRNDLQQLNCNDLLSVKIADAHWIVTAKTPLRCDGSRNSCVTQSGLRLSKRSLRTNALRLE